jgi:hypothetical protein
MIPVGKHARLAIPVDRQLRMNTFALAVGLLVLADDLL